MRELIPDLFPPALIVHDSGDPGGGGTDSAQVLLRGVRFVPRSGLQPWEQRQEVGLARCAAALRTVPSATALVRESAALVHGLWVPAEPDVHLAVPSAPRQAVSRLPSFIYNPAGTARHGRGQIVHLRRHALQIPSGRIVVAGGLPATDLVRTAVDCARHMPVRSAVPVVDSALRKIVRPDRFAPEPAREAWRAARDRMVDDLAAAGHGRGVRRARWVMAMATPWSESPGESQVRWFTRALGLPLGRAQVQIIVDGYRYFVDLCWPDLRIIIEFDGRLKYERMDVVWEEKLRQDRIEGAGWRFLRVTWDDLADLDALAARVLALFPVEIVRAARRDPIAWA